MAETNKGSISKQAQVRRSRVLIRIAEGVGVSKQRAWQMVRQAAGLCQKCGKPAEAGSSCKVHAKYDRDRMRNKKVTA